MYSYILVLYTEYEHLVQKNNPKKFYYIVYLCKGVVFMHILSAVLFAVSANIDCLAVGLSYGIKTIRIDVKSNLIIAIISTIGTCISMFAGSYITNILSLNMANLIGCIILIIFGGGMICKDIRDRYYPPATERDIQFYDKDNSGIIDIKESIALALALTINNVGLGVGASITGLPVIWSCIFTFLISILFIWSSQILGKTCISEYLHNYAAFTSGLLILGLGIYELFI